MNLQDLPPKARLAAALEERASRRRSNALAEMFPEEGPLRRELYAKHLVFFELGATKDTRGVIAANRVGKTLGAGGYEIVLHLTGRYPSWWRGRRFARPIQAWIAGDTKETVRDIVQRKLYGPNESPGTGLIPADCIGKATLRPQGNGALDTLTVKHVSGGWSELGFKSYDQGRVSFQGTEKDVIWLDEEAPPAIRSECVIRLMTRKGLLIETFTPLNGNTPTVAAYYDGHDINDWLVQKDTRAMVRIGWDDVPHLSQADKQRMLSESPPHERDARSKGIPLLGSGLVFPIEDAQIVCEPFVLPRHWPRINGIDFGWDHPTAYAWLAWDRDLDCVYLYDEYRRTEQPVEMHAIAMKKHGIWMPTAWPHDGHNDTAAGPQLAQQYRDAGLKMRPINAQFPETRPGEEKRSLTSVEAGVADMLTRMIAGKFKAFSTCQMFLGERRQYHRKDGKIVKEKDDLISAVRYAMMDLRFAVVRQDLDQAGVMRSFVPADPAMSY